MSQTSTTLGARDHARAMGELRVETMPTVPASDAVDLPAGVAGSSVVWDEVIAPGGYASKVVERGTVIRLTDLEGEACAAVLLHNAEQPSERLNVADTVKVQWQAYLGPGQLLLSDLGRVMASIVSDTSGRHDAFCGVSNRSTATSRYGRGDVSGPTPNARDQFIVALTKHGLGRRDVGPNVNLFKSVRVEPDGTFVFDGNSPSGTSVELLAEMHLIVTVVNSPHVLDDRSTYTCTPMRLTAWSGEPTSRDDERWAASPEGERSYLNTEQYYAGRPRLMG